MRLSTNDLLIIKGWLNCYEKLDETDDPWAKAYNKDIERVVNKVSKIIDWRQQHGKK